MPTVQHSEFKFHSSPRAQDCGISLQACKGTGLFVSTKYIVSQQRQALLPPHLLTVVCRKGEEVTISYGDWPNDVFLLFFGFLPDNNRHDAIVLFHGLRDLVQCYQALVHQQQNQASSQQQAERPLQTQQQQQQQQQTAIKDLKQQHPCNSQHPLTNKQSSNQQNDVVLQLRHQKDHANALPDSSHQEQANSLQCSEMSSESTAAESDAGASCTDSLVADLQDSLGHGDWTR